MDPHDVRIIWRTLCYPSVALIPHSALRMLQPETHETHETPLKAHWSHIGVHVNETPGASLRFRFITALKTDPLATEYRDNPPQPWSWQDGLLLHNNLIYVQHDDALRIELMQMHHDDPLAGH